ncbi:DNRLRE domain-containing protein [Sphaerisporangium sp. NPDC004334]
MVTAAATVYPGTAAGANPVPSRPSNAAKTPGDQTPSGDKEVEAAKKKARETGQRVEVPALFSENAKVWANTDGRTLSTELHTRPIQLRSTAKDGTAVWEPIDTTIVSENGRLTARRVKSPLRFGGKDSTTLVTAETGNSQGGFRWNKRLPAPVVSGDQAEYRDAVTKGVDLVVRAEADGFVQKIVLRERPKGPLSVELPMALPTGMTYGKGPDGAQQLLAKDGKPKAAPIAVQAVDALAEQSPDSGKMGEVKATVEHARDTTKLVLRPDAAFLSDPSVTYPVTMSVASEYIGAGLTDDAWVNKNNPSLNHLTDGWLRVGTTQTSADIARIYLHYNVTGTETLDQAKILDANLMLWNYRSGAPAGSTKNCGLEVASGTVARKLTSSWAPATLSWNNQPTWTTSGQYGNKAAYSDTAGCQTGELLWSIESIVQSWANGEPDHGLVLMAPSETTIINWRQFRSQESGTHDREMPDHEPILFIEYEPAPRSFEQVIYTHEGEPRETISTVTEVLQNQVAESATPPVIPPLTAADGAAEQASDEDTFEVDSSEIDDVPDIPDPPITTPAPVLNENPFFETGIAPWTASGGTLQRTQAKAYEQQAAALLTPEEDAGSVTVRSEAGIAVTENTRYSLKGRFLQSGVATEIEYGLDWFDANGERLTPSASRLTPDLTQWSSSENSYLSPAGVRTAQIRVSITTPTSPDVQTYLDELTLTESAQPDAVAPTVTATDPSANSIDIPQDTPIGVWFSEPVSNAVIELWDSQDVIVPGTSARASSTALTFTPGEPLKAGTRYTATVSGAEDGAGNGMADHHWSFTTTGTAVAGPSAWHSADSERGADATAAVNSFPYYHMDLTECDANPAQAFTFSHPRGWIKNLYSWCRKRTIGAALKRTIIQRNGLPKEEIVGNVEFTVTTLAKTFTGGEKGSTWSEKDSGTGRNSREIDTWIRVTNPIITQDLIALGGRPYYTLQNVSVHLGLQSSPWPTESACRPQGTNNRYDTLANWKAQPAMQITFFSDKNGSFAPHKLGMCNFTPEIRVTSPAKITYLDPRKAGMAPVSARCDTSETLTMRYGGCVFFKTPSFVVHRIYAWSDGSPIQNESTALIDDAFDRADSTWPTKYDGHKVIPGKQGSGNRLHRTSDGDINAQNRENSVDWCWRRWPLIVPQKEGLDCDEYPFATTLEGSARVNNTRNFAVRYVHHSHNRSVGGALPGFFARYRVLGSDYDGKNIPSGYNQFYVKVIN